MIDDKAADLGKLLSLEEEVRQAENLAALTPLTVSYTHLTLPTILLV